MRKKKKKKEEKEEGRPLRDQGHVLVETKNKNKIGLWFCTRKKEGKGKKKVSKKVRGQSDSRPIDAWTEGRAARPDINVGKGG